MKKKRDFSKLENTEKEGKKGDLIIEAALFFLDCGLGRTKAISPLRVMTVARVWGSLFEVGNHYSFIYIYILIKG